MAQYVAVTNTSPIIALVGAGQLPLLEALFSQVNVPFAVWDELIAKPEAPEPFALLGLRNVSFHPLTELARETQSLDTGERAAITLGLATPGAIVLLDELAARRLANRLGLNVVGSLGVLVKAKQEGLIPALRPIIEIMQNNGYRLGQRVVDAALRAAGESPLV